MRVKIFHNISLLPSPIRAISGVRYAASGGKEGYIWNRTKNPRSRMELAVWKRAVNEIAAYDIKFILILGGEPFLLPGIIEFLEYIHGKGVKIIYFRKKNVR
ncbi:hypothetical protein JW935_10270 [candidate division KSB1 bacterium]|nr:hypothetical protein [candidate division KSB1 bacterium]